MAHYCLIIFSLIFLSSNALSQSALDVARTSTSNGQNLTDQEKVLSETFVHQGKSQRELEEACNNEDDPKMRAACEGRDVNPKTAGLSGNMVQAITKAYTTVMGALALSGGGGLALKKQDVPEGQEPKKQDNTDYCQFIAIGTETVATFQQQTAQQNINSAQAQDTAQKEALYRASRSHKARSTNAKIQSAGWGVTTACYAAMMLRPSVSKSSITNWLKLGASGLLTVFFKDQASQHKEYANKVKDLADSLPGKGDCNPITQRQCYCAQPETENDPQYCLPEIHDRLVAENSFRVACTDGNAKADPQCNCAKSDSCLDTAVVRGLQATAADLNSSLSSSFLQALRPLARGELQSGSINGSALSLGKQARRNIEKSGLNIARLEKSGLNGQADPNQVKAFEDLGAPSALARRLALTRLTPQDKKNIAKFKGFNGSNRYSSRRSGKNKSNVLTFQRNSRRKKSRRQESFKNPFAKFNKKKSRGSRNTANVLQFARRAEQSAAQIDQRKETQLFDIISHRYFKSGRSRLGIK